MAALFKPAITAAALLLSTSAVFANDDGFFNVSYDNIGFTLTQIGGYGELKIEPNGFGDMSYGSCLVNFTRDETGAVKDMTPVVQQNSAKCPEKVAFVVKPAADGLFQLSFSEGGALKGETFDLYPVLRPMEDAFKVTAPAGFDIMGMTIGMTRNEVEDKLKSEGFAKLEGYTEVAQYQGYSRSGEVWGKGTSSINSSDPEDIIGLSYTSVIEGKDIPERVTVMKRTWNIPPSANLSKAVLEKSLAEKHGQPQSSFDIRIYDRAGELQPNAFQPACDANIHLQTVTYDLEGVGQSESDSPTSAACGAQVDIMVLEDFQAPGRASQLHLKLIKGDVAYEDFWTTWAPAQETALQQSYEMQAGMNSAAPKL